MKKMNPLTKKRGTADLLLTSLFRIGFMVIALLAFFLVISVYMNNKIDTKYLQAQTFKARLINSDSIMYQDPVTSVLYTGVVDMNKMSASLDKSIDYGDYARHVAAKIKIEAKPDLVDPNGKFLIETYYNKEMFNNWNAMINAKIPGKESATMYISKFPVTCYYNEKSTEYCTMSVEIIVPNS